MSGRKQLEMVWFSRNGKPRGPRFQASVEHRHNLKNVSLTKCSQVAPVLYEYNTSIYSNGPRMAMFAEYFGKIAVQS